VFGARIRLNDHLTISLGKFRVLQAKNIHLHPSGQQGHHRMYVLRVAVAAVPENYEDWLIEMFSGLTDISD
jgi:hypothetical protein